MIEKRTWEEFRNIGLLWWINMIMHTLGWSIVVEVEDNGVISNVYPGRVKYRGFSEDINTDGYTKLSNYIMKEADTLLKEASE